MEATKVEDDTDKIAEALVSHEQWRWGLGIATQKGIVVWVALSKVAIADAFGNLVYYYRPATGREISRECETIADLRIRLTNASTQGLLLEMLVDCDAVEEVSLRKEEGSTGQVPTEYLTVFMGGSGTTFTLEGVSRGPLLAAALLSIWDAGVTREAFR